MKREHFLDKASFWTHFYSHLSLKRHRQCHPLRILRGSWAETSNFKITTPWHTTTTSWIIRSRGNPVMKALPNPTGIYGGSGGRGVTRAALLLPMDLGIFELSSPQAISPNIAALTWEAVWRTNPPMSSTQRYAPKSPPLQRPRPSPYIWRPVIKQNQTHHYLAVMKPRSIMGYWMK